MNDSLRTALPDRPIPFTDMVTTVPNVYQFVAVKVPPPDQVKGTLVGGGTEV